MHTSIAPANPIRIQKASFPRLRLAIYAAALYTLCISAPTIYSANPAMRAYGQQQRISETLHDRVLSRVRQQHQVVLDEASGLENPEAKSAFLQAAIERAKSDAEGLEQTSELWQAASACRNTLFRRMTGDKVLAFFKQELRRHEGHRALVRRNVEELTHELRLCSAN